MKRSFASVFNLDCECAECSGAKAKLGAVPGDAHCDDSLPLPAEYAPVTKKLKTRMPSRCLGWAFERQGYGSGLISDDRSRP